MLKKFQTTSIPIQKNRFRDWPAYNHLQSNSVGDGQASPNKYERNETVKQTARGKWQVKQKAIKPRVRWFRVWPTHLICDQIMYIICPRGSRKSHIWNLYRSRLHSKYFISCSLQNIQKDIMYSRLERSLDLRKREQIRLHYANDWTEYGQQNWDQ